MTIDAMTKPAPVTGKKGGLPSRLHHNAYVTKDMEATRHFYEDILGFPLLATWCEQDELFGALRVYCHCFFGIGDGGALAFFQFANQGDQDQFGPPIPFSPFHHIALNVDGKTQAEIEGRIKAAGLKEPQTFVLEHGYCRSVYVTERPDRRTDPRRAERRANQQGPAGRRAFRTETVARRRPSLQQQLPLRLGGNRSGEDSEKAAGRNQQRL